MNRMKRIFGIGGILVLILVLLVMTTSAETNIVDQGQCGDQVNWTLDDQGLLTISGSGSMFDNLYGLGHQEDITSVVIMAGVTSIGDDAFSGCSSVANITIPDSVTDISYEAFRNCSNLTSITIPDSVTSIGQSAFDNCSSLTNINIPDGVTSIGSGAFGYCSNLVKIIIPDGVTSITDYVFCGCSNLSSITIPNGVTSIGQCALSNCSSLTSINIPDGVTSIGDNAFDNCSKLTSINIPNSVTSISVYAFNACVSLTDITIPEGVTNIDYGAFYACSSLVSITIPDSVTSIGDYAFSGCSSLTNIKIPDDVTSIGNYAFDYCSSLTSISIPDGVTSIGSCAFSNCFKLKKITIPESVKSIEGNAFVFSDPTVYCYEFSYADGWATEHGLSARYLDSEPVPVDIQLPESFLLPKAQTDTIPISLFPDDVYDLVWTSSDSSIVSVDNGKLTGHAKGTVTITVSCTRNDESELEASSLVTCYVPLESFTLCPAEVWVVAKESYQVQPVIVPTDAEEPFTWKSSNTAIATVSESGFVTTKAVGDVTITATSRSGLTQTMLLHCCYPVLSIAFEPAELQMSTDPVQLQATVTDTKGGTYVNKLITFTTSDPDIVTIDENGMLYPHKAGTAEITATSSNGKTATCTVTVGVDGHIPVTTIEAIDPTCTADGRTERIVCSDCGAVLSESVIIPALGHDTVTHEAQEPTCTDIGWNAYETCSRCDYSTYVEIPALEHDIQAYEAQEPTCTEDGHEAYEACSRCDYTTCVIIPALGHDTVTHEAQAPTCTEIGWEAYETCSRCDYSTYAELPALGHTVVTDSYIAPTRTTGGMTAGSHCSVCNEILEGNEYIAPLSDAPIVIVPEAVEGLGEEAYMGSGVVCVRLPDGCKYLGSRAFAQCTSLQVIEIPASVTDIATDAFEGTTGFVIITGYNSTAMNYAKEHNIRCQIDTWPTTD